MSVAAPTQSKRELGRTGVTRRWCEWWGKNADTAGTPGTTWSLDPPVEDGTIGESRSRPIRNGHADFLSPASFPPLEATPVETDGRPATEKSRSHYEYYQPEPYQPPEAENIPVLTGVCRDK